MTSRSSSPYRIRQADLTDLSYLPDIERSAGAVFCTVAGLESIANDEPISLDRLQEILEKGIIWVAVHDPLSQGQNQTTTRDDSQGRVAKEEKVIVGFLAVFPITYLSPQAQSSNSFLHIAELSIHGSHQRRGLGRQLITALISYAEGVVTSPSASPSLFSNIKEASRKVEALTLTTYLHVPFNGPFYASMGFSEIAADDIATLFGAEARRIWDEEQRSIPVPDGRGWMVRRV